MNKKNEKLKKWFITTLIICAFFAVFSLVLWIHGGYTEKVLSKIGIDLGGYRKQ